MKKYLESVLLSITVVVIAVASLTFLSKSSNQLENSSVMVLAPNMRSGGSGTIIHSDDVYSEILTNAHVCGILSKGGFIKYKQALLPISAFKKSKFHDLCLVKVNENLKINTNLSSNPPSNYSDYLTISGHPHLYPTLETKGKMSGNMIISLITDVRKCSEEEATSEDTGLLCNLYGGMPVVSSYKASLIAATIMPGSSGSGVFNDNNELTNVVFAGTQGLSYAFVVPYSDVKNFLKEEAESIDYNLIGTMEASVSGSVITDKYQEASRKAVEFCKENPKHKMCSLIISDMLWHQGLKW